MDQRLSPQRKRKRASARGTASAKIKLYEEPYPVEIEFRDLAAGAGWLDVAEAVGVGPVECYAAGLLLSETSETVNIVTALSKDGQVMHVFTIPKSDIKKIYRLYRKGEGKQ